MWKAFFFLAIILLLIIVQLFFPMLLLFVPILVVIGLLISPKWGIGLLFTYGLWLDSLYDHPLVIPYTILLVILGVSLELLRSNFSKKLHILGFFLVLFFSLIVFFVNVHIQEISLLLFGRLIIILTLNGIIYSSLYAFWQKISK